jgi:hypothetical protein
MHVKFVASLAGFIQLLISRKFGGSKSEGRLNSAFQKVLTACFLGFILADHSSDLDGGCIAQSTSMAGI